MHAFKDVQIRVVVQLTVYEARWLSNFLQNKQKRETNEDNELCKDLFEALQEALDLPENH